MNPPVKAKICGVSTAEAVSATLEGGAAFIGFNFFPASPRYVVPEDAARLALPVRGRVSIVAVTVDPDDALIDRLRQVLAPDLIQLHGSETPERAREIAARGRAGIIKAIAVSEAADIAAARPFESVADHLMFEARPPAGATRPGGLGARLDPSLLAEVRLDRPWFLAGGLDPWNVREAARLSGAPMVDVSSGVERGAGLKDPALISAFLHALGSD